MWGFATTFAESPLCYSPKTVDFDSNHRTDDDMPEGPPPVGSSIVRVLASRRSGPHG